MQVFSVTLKGRKLFIISFKTSQHETKSSKRKKFFKSNAENEFSFHLALEIKASQVIFFRLVNVSLWVHWSEFKTHHSIIIGLLFNCGE